mmetsp:Transcript_7917/g.27245  ORF Transcript_7917/g.27245 Transcript_7917/m.27245 type:complete len:364 (-) Transcript_7917:644-1735(-)
MSAPPQDTGDVELFDDLFGHFREARVFDAPPAVGNTEAEQTEPPKVNSLDFHNSEPLLVSVTDKDAGIRLYDVSKGTEEMEFFSAKYGASSVRFTHHPMAILYASTRKDKAAGDNVVEHHAIRYHSLHDNAYLRYFKAHEDEVLDIEMSTVSDTFLSVSKDRTVRRWDLRTEKDQEMLDLKKMAQVNKPRIACDRADEIVALGVEGGDIRLYTTKALQAGDFHSIQGPQSSGLVRPHISCLKLSNGGNLVAALLQGTIFVYKIDSGATSDAVNKGNVFRKLETGVSSDLEFDFTPDDKYIISGCGVGSVVVWSLESGNEVARVEGGGLEVPTCLRWSPRQALFATGSSKLSLWIPETVPGRGA